MAEGCRKERFRRCAMAAGGVALVAVGCLSVAEMRRPGRSARSDALLGGRAALTSRPQAERDGRLSALMGIDTDAPGAALNWEKKHPEEEVTVIEYMDDLWGEQVGADHALREKQLEAAQPSQDAADVAPTTVVGLPLATTPPPAPIPECAMPVSPPERCNGLQEVHGQEGTVTAGVSGEDCRWYIYSPGAAQLYLNLAVSLQGPDAHVLIYEGAETQVYMHEDVLNAARSFKAIRDTSTASYEVKVPSDRALVIYQVPPAAAASAHFSATWSTRSSPPPPQPPYIYPATPLSLPPCPAHATKQQSTPPPPPPPSPPAVEPPKPPRKPLILCKSNRLHASSCIEIDPCGTCGKGCHNLDGACLHAGGKCTLKGTSVWTGASCQTCELRYADVPEGVYVNYYKLTAPLWPSEAHSCRSKDSFVSKKGRITGPTNGLQQLGGAMCSIYIGHKHGLCDGEGGLPLAAFPGGLPTLPP